jgi:hypothetical protein
MPGAAHGQIYVTNGGNGTIGEYDAVTGATINAALVSGLSEPTRIAVSGGHIWVALNGGGNPVAEYDATTGALINASAISQGSCGTLGLAVSGNNLYVLGQGGCIGLYDATTGAPITVPFITLPPIGPGGYNLAVSGGYLYVVFDGFDVLNPVAVYDATTGASINPSLISGLHNAVSIAVSGGNLWVGLNADDYGGTAVGLYTTGGATINSSMIPLPGESDYGMAVAGGYLFVTKGGSGTIGKYDATTGAVVNASLVSGLNGPFGIAVVGPQSISDLIAIINSQTSLTAGQQNSLNTKLNAAQSSIAANNSNAACGQLSAFINEVNARQHSGALSQTTANELITFVQNLNASLGCP